MTRLQSTPEAIAERDAIRQRALAKFFSEPEVGTKPTLAKPARKAKPVPEHGTRGRYTWKQDPCRCAYCCEAHKEHYLKIVASRRAKANAGAFEHGTTTGYSSYECRCTRCRKAWADYQRDRYQSKNPR